MFKSKYLDAVDAHACVSPDTFVFRNSVGQTLTYGQLQARSNALALFLHRLEDLPEHAPVIVFGHKSPYMLVAMHACAKAGHPYVPLDAIYPADRVANIISQIGDTLVFDTSSGALDWASLDLDKRPQIVGLSEIEELSARDTSVEEVETLPGLDPTDVIYIIFTSGSTGAPKGVEVMSECVDGFLAWLDEIYNFAEPGGRIWFNRAAYSFDLSVTDLVYAPAHGDTCFALEGPAETSLAEAFSALSESHITDWVSTPSFLDQCLADESFGPDLLPDLKRMLFVGETLRPVTVELAKKRFGDLSIYNGYGPTESCDFVSLCEIDDEMVSSGTSLPVGYAMEGMELAVLDPETLERKPDGEPGELFILGHTVAKGYFGRPDLTDAAFHSCPESIAKGRKSYRTGDEMTKGPDGLYYFHGRLDLQIKLHGFRIELGDIESRLSAIPIVQSVCVVPVIRDGVTHHLCACVVVADTDLKGLKLTRKLKGELAETLPAYMIPTTFKYLDELPLNNNGKIDRKALAQAYGG